MTLLSDSRGSLKGYKSFDTASLVVRRRFEELRIIILLSSQVDKCSSGGGESRARQIAAPYPDR